jgi:hypothetical protein
MVDPRRTDAAERLGQLLRERSLAGEFRVTPANLEDVFVAATGFGRNVELMVGKITPYILIGLAQVTLILATGVALFDVPVAGSRCGKLILG